MNRRLVGGMVVLGALSMGCQGGPVESPSPVVTMETPAGRPVPTHAPATDPTPTPSGPTLSPHQAQLLGGARSTLGDRYDDGYYAGGPPPAGRGACTDVVYQACLAGGLNLQESIEQDISRNPGGYPNLGDRNINYRRAPNLIVWFKRHTLNLSTDKDFRPGDIVFWSLLDDGVADHVGVVAEREGFVIHNVGPRCSEDRSLYSWPILGHFRTTPP